MAQQQPPVLVYYPSHQCLSLSQCCLWLYMFHTCNWKSLYVLHWREEQELLIFKTIDKPIQINTNLYRSIIHDHKSLEKSFYTCGSKEIIPYVMPASNHVLIEKWEVIPCTSDEQVRSLGNIQYSFCHECICAEQLRARNFGEIDQSRKLWPEKSNKFIIFSFHQ
jgi:hypothetical protein